MNTHHNYGWDTNLPRATWINSEEETLGGQEEAQTDTDKTEDFVLNLVNEPTFAREHGYYVCYRFYRHEEDRGEDLTIWASSELKEWYLDGRYDITDMTEQEVEA